MSYLGDGLYFEYDGFQVRLFTSNGVSTTNEVFLEPQVMQAFFRKIEETFGVEIKPKKESERMWPA